jgi:hypothetical protein
LIWAENSLVGPKTVEPALPRAMILIPRRWERTGPILFFFIFFVQTSHATQSFLLFFIF